MFLILSGAGKSPGHVPQWPEACNLLRTLRQPPLARRRSFKAIATGGAVVHFAPMPVDTSRSQSHAAATASLSACL